jgi:Tfp pilus assembly protein PilV
MTKPGGLSRDASGSSLLEVTVAVLILSLVLLGLTSAGVVASAQLRMGREDVTTWTAVHYQMDKLLAQGYDNVTAGTATVHGHDMSWVVQGTNPKKVILVVQVKNSTGAIVPDTFVTYLADPTP